MSRLLVVSDDNTHIAEVVTDPETGHTEARCPCGEVITDRGHFEDTCNAAGVHVDAEPGPGGVISW